MKKKANPKNNTKKNIRKIFWTLIAIDVALVIIMFAVYFVAPTELAQEFGTIGQIEWLFFGIIMLINIITLVGLYQYKKWAFYIITIFFAIGTIETIIDFDIFGILFEGIIFWYLIWYKGLYLNRSGFE